MEKQLPLVNYHGTAPRPCNTGVHNSPRTFIKIDWLEMTVKDCHYLTIIEDILKLDFSVFTEAERGMHGYPNMFVFGFVRVLHNNDKPALGTKIILSAQALDQVGNDAIEIIKQGLLLGGSFARIDLALDDRFNLLSFSEIEKTIESGSCVTNFQTFDVRRPRCTKSLDLKGRSIEWGSRQSDRFLVLYDKQMERINAGDYDSGHWLRFEGRWFKRAAMNLAVELALNGLSSGGGLLRGLIDFRDNSDENKSRCLPLSWWSVFTDNLEIIKTGIKKLPKTIQDKCDWIQKQLCKPLGQVAAIIGVDQIALAIRAGIEATSPAVWQMLDPANLRKDFRTDQDLTDFFGLAETPF